MTVEELSDSPEDTKIVEEIAKLVVAEREALARKEKAKKMKKDAREIGKNLGINNNDDEDEDELSEDKDDCSKRLDVHGMHFCRQSISEIKFGAFRGETRDKMTRIQTLFPAIPKWATRFRSFAFDKTIGCGYIVPV